MLLRLVQRSRFRREAERETVYGTGRLEWAIQIAWRYPHAAYCSIFIRAEAADESKAFLKE
jgi:hypothetical protein